MKKSTKDRANPKAAVAAKPVAVPDVAKKPHQGASNAEPSHEDNPMTGPTVLEEALPEINAAAKKVGGFKKLAEIAAQLDNNGVGE